MLCGSFCADDRIISHREQVDRLQAKFDVLVSTPGAIDHAGRRETLPGHAGILVVDLVRPGDAGMDRATAGDVGALAKHFLAITQQPAV